MNTNPAISRPFSSVRVRQAIRAALDYNGIIDGLMGGIGTQLNGMIPVGLIGNDRATNNRLRSRTNLGLARRLLREAGYPRGFTTKMQYPAGFTFDGVSFDVLAPKVAHDLAAISIRVTFVPTPLSVVFPAWRDGKQDALFLWAWGVDFPDPSDDTTAFASGGFNARHVSYTWDAHQAQLAVAAKSTFDVKKRAALYRQIQQIWLREGPWAAIVQPQGIVVLHHGVSNYLYSPVYPNSLSFVRKS
jgi:peptide/nickel transport system substrate-binding protein